MLPPESGTPTSGQQFQSAFRLAAESLRAHKLRSFLTLLGVIIGVASVIMVGAAIAGLGVYAEQSTAKAFGSESFMVAQIAATGRLSRREYFDKLRRNKPIYTADAHYLEGLNGDRVLYSPYRNHASDVKHANLTCEQTTIIGASADLASIRDIGVADGRFFTPQEDRSRSYVAVIGQTVRDTLFPGESSPLGQIVKIEGVEFNVIGVQEKLGSAFGRDQDNSIYIPSTAFDRLYGPGTGFALFGAPKPGSGLTLQEALDLTRVALRTRFHAHPGQDDNFDTLTPDAIRGFIDSLLSMVAAVVVPVTCISLLVGGIVIMNIMLVSVTERTHEIGVRKALGARHSDVMLQVLIEAVLLAMIGGGVGIAIGAVVTEVLGRVFDLSLHITFGYVALALGVSTIVGVASGWYPASRAAKLDPVVALRAE
ncbi:MAG TPA: ABC transporter permease [Bryobacteraceae bacterium]|jgi:putative ABC transport system permease protein|nr:ABC transporter permease [Bryobacteraceae bacterium]